MAVSSSVLTPIPENVFKELCTATWEERIQKDYGGDMPTMPSFEEVKEAVASGELDEGLPEFFERLNLVLHGDASSPYDPGWEPSVSLPGFGILTAMVVNTALDGSWDDVLRFRDVVVAPGLVAFHNIWKEKHETNSSLKHPFVSLIEAWFKLPSQIEPERKRVGILPSSLRGARALEYLPGLAPEEAPLGNQGQEAMLPGLASIEGTIVPTAIVQTWARGGGTELNRGRGAPLSKRIFYEVLTEMSFDARRIPGRKHIILTLRDLRDWLYPREDGKRHNFRPQRDIEKIRDALWEVDQMRIKVIPPGDKVPTNWRVIDVRAFPDPHLDSRVEFYIELPPGSSGGALIDRYAMRRYGLVSAPQHSASLGMAYYWDKYGTYNGRRILATRPRVARNSEGNAIGADGQAILDQRQRPITGFSDESLIFLNEAGYPVQGRTLSERRKLAHRERNPAVDRYPVLLANDLLMLCYPESAADLNSNTSRKSRNLRFKRLERAKDTLEQMEDDGYCVIESAVGDLGEAGYRVMPTAWASFGLC